LAKDFSNTLPNMPGYPRSLRMHDLPSHSAYPRSACLVETVVLPGSELYLLLFPIVSALKGREYSLNEVMPPMASRNCHPCTIAHGCSLGAYHAVNIAFRHPHLFLPSQHRTSLVAHRSAVLRIRGALRHGRRAERGITGETQDPRPAQGPAVAHLCIALRMLDCRTLEPEPQAFGRRAFAPVQRCPPRIRGRPITWALAHSGRALGRLGLCSLLAEPDPALPPGRHRHRLSAPGPGGALGACG
jgi:hypothetical protein